MTPDEFNAAQTEHDLLPGTPPDGYSSRPMSDDPDENRARFREMADHWRSEMKWLRFTIDEDYRMLWVEVWKERPDKEAPFNPPYTADQQDLTVDVAQ